MPEWFERAFGAVVDAAARGLNSARDSLGDELITRGWFSRNPTPGGGGNDLGWFRKEATDDGRTLLDRLFDTNPELFSIEPNDPAQDIDHGIDR